VSATVKGQHTHIGNQAHLENAGIDVAPLAGGLDRWLSLELPVENRPFESLPIR